ncbi:Cytochrome b5 reductase 4 [Fulvia fulva]|uniref:Cytochrome b5 reductase 4 n=1 Tax=Passalora fulva TaxID=5499 RepID=A0A9Q8L8P2_PASFU|nr:Cytochrome b5 reductase 4 [Fulvia fulva]KAK4634690.1 Cytochrome b5 reductase 4 [Fulvia fulva]KAK4637415.1 Cytochrome b5 reductase 4 [Fulvia fulva]UJO12903.1 Cytochrome b5 reductase 4 [Fulvia fulva]WPV08418.1 Cytochrome b5 reductase 4 [Fulvia fulva]WPV24181.1 Cytochrome b5 reductase 4 [Fulvia fulva]
MGLLALGALLLGILYIVYTNPKMLRNWLPGWLATDQQKDNNVEIIVKTNEKDAKSPAGSEQTISDQDASEETTPKAKPSKPEVEVPTFTLSGNDHENDPESDTEPSVPSFPAANSAQRASAMPPPPKPAVKSSPGLMAPPARPVAAPRASPAAGLRVPTTGPLPNRGPPVGSQQRVSNGLSPNGAVKTPNARGKVLLSPGHSPMDWAALTKSGNISGVSSFQRVTPSQLKSMTGRKGKPAWSSWQGKVYNITPYLPFHPGGEAELMKAAGRDGTKLFMEVHPWVNWENMLSTCLVGVLVPEDYAKSSLEDMD